MHTYACVARACPILPLSKLYFVFQQFYALGKPKCYSPLENLRLKLLLLRAQKIFLWSILIEWMFVRVFLQQNSLNFFPGARRAFVTFYKVPSLSLLLTPHFVEFLH